MTWHVPCCYNRKTQMLCCSDCYTKATSQLQRQNIREQIVQMILDACITWEAVCVGPLSFSMGIFIAVEKLLLITAFTPRQTRLVALSTSLGSDEVYWWEIKVAVGVCGGVLDISVCLRGKKLTQYGSRPPGFWHLHCRSWESLWAAGEIRGNLHEGSENGNVLLLTLETMRKLN